MSSLRRRGPLIGRVSSEAPCLCAGETAAFFNSEEFVIADKDVGRVKSRSGRRRAILVAAGLAIIALSAWIRQPHPLPAYAVADARLDAARALAGLRTDLDRAQRNLGAMARQGLGAPSNPDAAFSALNKIALPSDEYGVVLYDEGRPVAWRGKVFVSPDSLPSGLSAARSTFYTSLNFVALSGKRASVATAVVDAQPPADKLTGSIATRVSAASGVSAFSIVPGTDSIGEIVAGDSARPLLRASALSRSPGERSLAHETRIRAVGVVLLCSLVVALFVFAWRDRRALADRLIALVSIGIALAIVPWNSFSNTISLFDPAHYYYRAGGALFAANAGVLLFETCVLLLAVIAIVRGNSGKANRFWILSVIAAMASVILARRLAAGIGQPPWGSTPFLWLSWELPIFLLLFSSFFVAAWALASNFFPRIAIFRIAIGSALIAAAIAISIVWSRTTTARMHLAEQDIASAMKGDDYTAALVRRFGEELFDAPDVSSRADLLRRFASSDLAAAGDPAILAFWPSSGGDSVELELAELNPNWKAVRSAVEKAAGSHTIISENVAAGTGIQTVLVTPAASGVVSIVASPRTRLVTPNPYDSFLGLSGPPGVDPPYTISLAEAESNDTTMRDTVAWRHVGNELHTDRPILTRAGLARAHAEVDLRSPGARIQRAVLIAIFDLGFAGLLWLLGAFAERGFPRWFRRRANRWLDTYRARLTLALFLFFVLPAVVFAFWSYERLRSDDRQVRALLVDETLHAIARNGAYRADTITSAAPIFIYQNGALQGASDPLFAELTPLGRMLPPAVHRRLTGGRELTAVWETQLASADVLLAFRSAMTKERLNYVLAAPARRDELVLDRRRRDLGILVLFATACGAIAALWLSGIAAKRLARDLELSRIEVARAERVIAWGEMARQVAHEIKNPLTPIRLGIQHLQRARRDSPAEFDRALNENATRILSEIDRLDQIAREFSRYGRVQSDMPVPAAVDAAAILRDVIELEKIGGREVRWKLTGAQRELLVFGREDELRDVLFNVFENARQAGAKNVTVSVTREAKQVLIEVVDDGAGIPAENLARIFEPHFSTRTTGSGLGLAVTRRLIESWGGSIDITSGTGAGARALILLRTASE